VEGLASAGVTGLPGTSGITDPGSNALRLIAGAEAATGRSDSGTATGGMITLRYRCCSCKCSSWFGYFKSYDWKCDDVKSKSYVIDDETGDLYPYTDTSMMFRRGTDKLTEDDAAKAVADLEENTCK
jgi:hypothetical protein